MMKTFLINLDKNTERLENSKRQLDEIGVEFERISAVYGKDLPEQEKRAAVNHFRWWCTQGRKVRDGEIGCALSHLGIYRRMIAENIPYACILEDDVTFQPRFPEVIDAIEKFLDTTKPQVITMICLRSFGDQDCTLSISPSILYQCTGGYVITQKAAKNIVSANYPIQVPADGWGRWVKWGAIELYETQPRVCGQIDRTFYKSDVETDDMERVSSYSFIPWVIFKTKRLIGVIIDNMLPHGDFT